MSTQKLQVGRALAVIKSDTVDIPFPALVTSGNATGGSATSLVNSGATFITSGVQVGDIIYNVSTLAAAIVTGVNSDTTLLTSGGAFAASQNYVIYSGENNNGCVLYIGGAGNLAIQTVGGDTVTLVGVTAGQFIPVQVMKVLSATTATNILALW
jgi:hypothetical protein